MAVYDLELYDFNPSSVIGTTTGSTFTYSGGSPTGTASVTDATATLTDDTLRRGPETATANVSVNGVSSTGSSVDADAVWTVTDLSTGETFQVVQFVVDTGSAAGSYTLSEQPLIDGHDYQVTAYSSTPGQSYRNGTSDEAFTYADYVSTAEIADGIVSGTSGDDTLDSSYTDTDGDTIDTETYTSGTMHWAELSNGQDYMDGSGTLEDAGVTMTFSVTNDGGGGNAYDPTGTSYNYGTYVANGESFDADSSFFLFGDNDANNDGRGELGSDTMTMTMDFAATESASGVSDEVYNVSFRINDLDLADGGFVDVITITAYDAEGNEVSVTLTGGSAMTIDGNTVTGVTATASTDQSGSLLVEIAGPVSSIVIDYDNEGVNTQGVWLSDIQFESLTTDYDDTIEAGDGDDIVDAGLGDDLVYGGDGNDTIDGGVGNDEIYAGAGDDTVTGGDGNDTIYGYEGSDTVDGGDGDDYINTRTSTGTGLPDTAYDHPDSSLLDYGADSDPTNDMDTVYGGAGNDTILTGDDDDYIEGGSGDDDIDAGFDDDVIYGDAGADTIQGNVGNDTIDGGDDDDIIYGDVSPDSSDYAAYSYYELDDDGVATSVDSDPTDNSDVIYGGAGNDTIYGQDDADTLYGGEGDDTLDGGIDDDTLDGGEGDDTLIGGRGDDTITGGAGADVIDGGEGDDTIYAGGGDSVTGGEGNDTIIIDPSQLDGNAITVIGSETGDETGDVLDLSGLSEDLYHRGSIVYDENDPESGTLTLSDGTVITFSNIETIICFAKGTRIATPYGARRVEELRPGDLVITMDNGLQPLRWVGARTVPAMGRFAPIEIAKGTLGNETDLIVSPQHRMLLRGWHSEMLFGTSEVFSAAKHLVNGTTIRERSGGMVSYYHLMFDRHEVIFAEGAATESFHVSDHSLTGVTDAARDELFTLFPELRALPGQHGDTARKCLKAHEAELFVA
ncbi:Hint domain-containing protein [Celeribacter persicus]|uniref:Ca2+-binding RTX toxin-like protein n=1 Tax=Celeribacter persicus TaxID=1651082 RepID=A0A2T5H4H3_9RHOB|nr:Hint domain-containing protein [Celeribacter persicus]PTQ66454.1 Ca2+-binding RTX toxin-like protein [Celeribacter persicus]